MIDNLVPLVATLMIFGIPLSAIIGSYYLKAKKLAMQKNTKLTNDDEKKIKMLLAENDNLRHRIENLEEIVSDVDMPKIGEAGKEGLQRQIDFLAEEVRKLRKPNTP